MNTQRRDLDWFNIFFLTTTPIGAAVGGYLYTKAHGITWMEIALFTVMFFATGLSITAGYHRYFSHVSYQANPLVRLFYLVFGATAMQNSVLHWAADHRHHHRYTDTDQDPYNAGRGFWWSHIGWIFYKSHEDRDFAVVADLQKDPLVRFQHKYHVQIALVVGFLIPTLLGFMVGRPMGFFLWGGLIRLVFVHHVTFFINSLAHMWGKQPFSKDDSSVDSWWLAFLTNGEGYHNFHHKFPSDYRNGISWYHWDPSKWLIAGLHKIGMTWKLHRVPDHLILRARLEVEALEAAERLSVIPQAIQPHWKERLETTRKHAEETLLHWANEKALYWEAKKAAFQNSDQVAQYKLKLKACEKSFKEARDRWKENVRLLGETPIASI